MVNAEHGAGNQSLAGAFQAVDPNLEFYKCWKHTTKIIDMLFLICTQCHKESEVVQISMGRDFFSGECFSLKAFLCGFY